MPGLVRVHLEYEQMTVGQLGRYLDGWQALLRTAWREEAERLEGRHIPVRVFPARIATGESIDVLMEYAVKTYEIFMQAGGAVMIAVAAKRLIAGAAEHLLRRDKSLAENFSITSGPAQSVSAPGVVLASERMTANLVQVIEATQRMGGIMRAEMDEDDSR